MICSPCGAENAAPRRFCGQCGAHLHAVCGHCGFDNLATDRYCGGCGDALPAERGERPARSPARTTRPPAIRAVPAPAPAPAVAASAPPAPTPPAAFVPSAKPAARGDDPLTSSELSDLLRRSSAPASAPTSGGSKAPELPEGSITQDSLDALFGG